MLNTKTGAVYTGLYPTTLTFTYNVTEDSTGRVVSQDLYLSDSNFLQPNTVSEWYVYVDA